MNVDARAPGPTVELTYHRTKVDPNPDYLGCLLLLIGLPLNVYSIYLLFHSHDLSGFCKTGITDTVLIAVSFFTPRFFRKSDESYAEAYASLVHKGETYDERATAILARVRSTREVFWLYLRPFMLENQLLVVSTEDRRLAAAPNLVRYADEGFADPKHQPVDLFDNLQRGFSGPASAPFISVGRRPHPLHDAVGYIQATDENWQQVISELAAAATFVVCMPWDTSGVVWETELLTNHMLNKTLFVMPACYSATASVKVHGSLFPFPWFAISPLDTVPEYTRRWTVAIKPLVLAGLEVPEYNWCGMVFGYGSREQLFTLRIPVHPREFSLCFPEIMKHLR